METWVPGAGRDEVALWRQLTLLMEQANATAGKRLTRCHGVSVNELLLLLPLAERRDGTLRMSELIRSLGVNQSVVSRMAARLEDAGWVTRRSAPDDKRGVDVQITVAGRRLAGEAEQTLRRTLAEVLDAAALNDPTASLVARLRYAPATPLG
ncbi:MarR family transcriptional regulator [Streptomyces sp. NBC_01218]|uniref:MarR family transcriptional regulator n=1 Tax=unclassified Streptomyces TaxID=2593676 RepID=UPI0023B92922|nr:MULTISPECIES: MarR family transcriptional regulator [unclassified Streptomyces]WEH39243.1 MarR family transcriptional regulator [Streptomyces sp. AM 2-1-1]WSQ50893.1 MarR family transcriptional regulator [Streptomyces sp. NBC_01218]